jgi:hypothetical protein
VGVQLFEHFVREEHVSPARLAYDRPSPKLLGFVGKHYHLKSFTPQANNYVVFAQYFDTASAAASTRQPSGALSPTEPDKGAGVRCHASCEQGCRSPAMIRIMANPNSPIRNFSFVVHQSSVVRTTHPTRCAGCSHRRRPQHPQHKQW